AAHVEELLGLVDNCIDYVGVGVAGGTDGDAGGEIKEPVSVDVPYKAAFAAVHYKWIIACVGWRHNGAGAVDNGPGLTTWKGAVNEGKLIGCWYGSGRRHGGQ